MRGGNRRGLRAPGARASGHKPILPSDAPRRRTRSRCNSTWLALVLLSCGALVVLLVLLHRAAELQDETTRVSRPAAARPKLVHVPAAAATVAATTPHHHHHPPPPPPPPQPPPAPPPTCANVSHVGADARCSPHKFLFIGGLQRSGTSTLASLLGEVPGVSGLRFDALDPRHMEAARGSGGSTCTPARG